MKRVLNGVHVLMAIGLVVALAACSGSDSGIKRDRDQAQAAAEAAEAAKAAAEAAQAQAEADKAAAEAAQAAADAAKTAAEAAQAAADAAKTAAEADLAQAEADKAAAEADLAQAEADKMELEADLAQAEADKMALEDQLAGVPKAIDELEADLAAAMEARDMAQTDKDAADMALEDAMKMRMAAQTGVDESAPEGLTDAIAALEAARVAEMAAEAVAMDAADALTAAEADVDTAQAAVDATDTGPASEELAGQEEKAGKAGARKAFALLMGIADSDRSGEGSPAASHDGEAVTFSVSGWKQSADKMAPPIDGWSSAVLTGKPDIVVGDTTAKHGADAIVYSNIEAPEMELFANVYGAAADIVAAGTADDERDFKNVVIPPANKYSGSTTAGSIAGSFRSVEGTFKCSEGCGTGPAARRSDGTIITMAGTWTFEPKDDEVRVPGPDSDYLAFGYWLSKSPAGDPSGFAVWYSGSKAVAGQDAYEALDEKANYSGVAGGKYVTKDELAADAAAGYFTAAAKLTADFSADAPTLTGTISGFTDPDGGAPLSDLELTLESAEITYAQDTAKVLAPGAADADATTSVTAKLGGDKPATVGGWEAELFGVEKNTNLPTGVVGSFDATIGTRMSVMGGFAAEKQ